jgi:putative peptidoglycan lipid II flippase
MTDRSEREARRKAPADEMAAAPPAGLAAVGEVAAAAPAEPGAAVDHGRSVRSVVGRAALIILAATLVGRALGMVRDIAVAYFFGAQADTDAFFLAYKVPYLLELMVGGALTATFVPLFSYRLATGRKREAWDLSVNIGNIICLILIGLSALLAILSPWVVPLIGPGLKQSTIEKGVFLFRILMIGLTFDGLAGLVIGMLNSLRKFALAAFAPAVGTVVTLVLTIALARPLGINALAVGFVAGSVTGLFVLFPGLRKQGVRYHPRIQWHDPTLREVGGMVWPILLGSAVGKVSVFIIQLLGSLLEQGSISSLNYADKLFQLPLGLFVAGISVPIFPLLSEQVAAKAPERVKATLDFALRVMGFLLIPVTVGVILLRYPLIGLLLQHGEFTAADTTRTAWALLFLCIGLYAYSGRDTLTRVFYAYHDTRTPVKISVVTVVITIGLAYLFMQFMGVGGLTLGMTVALSINFVVLMWMLRRKIGVIGLRRTGRSLVLVLAASAVMGVVIWVVDHFLAPAAGSGLGGNALRLVVGIVVGAGTFLFAARLVRMRELAETVDMLRAVLKRRSRPEEKSA